MNSVKSVVVFVAEVEAPLDEILDGWVWILSEDLFALETTSGLTGKSTTFENFGNLNF